MTSEIFIIINVVLLLLSGVVGYEKVIVLS